MKLLRFILWLLLFLCLFSGFFVLFQFGPSGFVEGAKSQIAEIQKLLGMTIK
jgi:hypothetical protein